MFRNLPIWMTKTLTFFFPFYYQQITIVSSWIHSMRIIGVRIVFFCFKTFFSWLWLNFLSTIIRKNKLTNYFHFTGSRCGSFVSLSPAQKVAWLPLHHTSSWLLRKSSRRRRISLGGMAVHPATPAGRPGSGHGQQSTHLYWPILCR